MITQPMIRAITLDCAETLVKVRWSPGYFALDCAKHVGMQLDEPLARAIYERLVLMRRADYEAVNLTRDADACVAWWRTLTVDWLAELNESVEMVEPIMEASWKLLYEPPDRYFELFSDVRPTLDHLRSSGTRLAVLSNWDYSLHRVIRAHELTDRFELVIASLEEGVEKPNSKLFEIAATRLELEANEILHVGDNPIDDFEGARNAGFHSVLLDRNAADISETVIASLTSIQDWIFQFG